MPPTSLLLQEVEDRKFGAYGGIPLTELGDMPASFPMNLWTQQLSRYENYWRWFTGAVYEETIPKKQDKYGKPILRYPLQINHASQIAHKFSYLLFGEVADGPNALVPAKITPRRRAGEKEIDPHRQQLADELEFFVNDVWNENDGRVLQQEGGLVQQPLGGIVYRVVFDPSDENLRYHIRIEMILPDFFMPVWESNKPDNLLEAFIIYRIQPREAEHLFALDLHTITDTAYVIYCEHWTKDEIHITVNNTPINYVVEWKDEETGEMESVTINYDHAPNPFGEIPLFYIPRERAGGYWGESCIDGIMGESREINARLADLGDSISDTSHSDTYVKNIRGSVTPIDMGHGRSAINLGVSSGTQPEPQAFRIPPPAIPAGMTDFPNTLNQQLGRDSFVPPVANGEDEGSQRSALTLAFRMWPMTAKIRAMRTYWQSGLVRMNKFIAKLAVIKNIGGITVEHIKECDHAVTWSPIIPRDREQEVNEAVLMMQTNSMAPVTAIERMNSVNDPQAEYRKIQDHITWLMTLQASLAAAGKADGGAGAGSAVKPAAGVKAKTMIQDPIATSGEDNK